MLHITPETIIRKYAFCDEAVDVWVPVQWSSEGVQHTDKAGRKPFGFVLLVEHVENDTADSLKETVQKRAVFQKERTEILINGKNTVSVSTGDKFKSHTSGTFLGIFDPTGRAKAAFATKGNKLHVIAMRAYVHSAPKGRVATMDHPVHVVNDNRTGMKLINHFFVVVCENLLQYIHKTIMQERTEKENPHPSKIEGQGS